MKRRILVAEDDEGIRQLVVDALEGEGFEMDASFGAGALLKAMTRPPDLLILDLMMPDIDGIEIKAQLARYPHTKDIPIIIMTAFRHPERYFRDLGAAGYLVKPFSIETLFTLVRSVLGLKGAS